MAEIDWLKAVIKSRPPFNSSSDESEKAQEIIPILYPPDPATSEGTYSNFIAENMLCPEERLLLILALTPHLAPQVLDVFFARNASYNRPFTEFGGTNGQRHKGFLPTWETYYFIVAGNDLSRRIEIERKFHHANHWFFVFGILEKPSAGADEPLGASPLTVTARFQYLAIFEQTDYIPPFGHQFPAALYRSNLEWEDLVLSKTTKEAVEEIKDWITHHNSIFALPIARKMLLPGFRALFYGPPGTGKSLTAGLLGKETGRLVFRVDLSKVVSKYIGETEKNLANIFDQAQYNDWLLFFDEADALFGQRVKTSDAKDRYANQETAYLLQRVETFPGVVILATNQIGNLDKAFARRFQAVIHFPTPGLYERIQLWKNTFGGFSFKEEATDALWQELAEKRQLTGANIQNILRRSLLLAHKNNSGLLQKEDIEMAIDQEVEKEKRMG